MKTLDILAKGWWDKVNGNSYFSARVIVDYGMETEKTFFVPYQYGYGDFFQYAALDLLAENGIISNIKNTSGILAESFYSLRQKGVIIRSYAEKNCRKRDVVAWGKE